jgi:hypothetical protein
MPINKSVWRIFSVPHALLIAPVCKIQISLFKQWTPLDTSVLGERSVSVPELWWWARRDLNPQPRDYESPALTVELQALQQLTPITVPM